MVSVRVRQIGEGDGEALAGARHFARRDLLSRSLLHATLEQPSLRARTRHWCALHGSRVVGLAAEVDGVFPYRSAPIAAALPGAAAALLARLERPFACLAPEMLWSELARAGGCETHQYLQMVRLIRSPPSQPDPRVKRVEDPEELAAFLACEFPEVRLQLGPYAGIRDEGGRLAAVAGVEFMTDRLAQLAHVLTREENRRQGLARALVTELVRELESPERHVALHVRSGNGAAVELFGALGFRGSRRFAKLEFGLS